MVNKNLILISFICMLITCSNLLANRGINRGEDCHTNIRVLLDTIEM